MSKTPALVVAHRQNQLWPSIHAASDVYLRRRGCGAEPYELIWRLLHIWECCVITLASAAAARIHSIDDLAELDRTIREKCFGVSRNDLIGKLERQGFGALDGSVDRWVEILSLASNLPLGKSPFLDAVIHFLNGSHPPENDGSTKAAALIDLGPFVTAWRGACDVPSSLPSGPVEPKAAMRVVNSFRNRFAHVPFPYDRLDEIYRQLEPATFQLFECQPLGSGAALLGGVRYRGHLVVGSSHSPDAFDDTAEDLRYVFGYTKKEPGEDWSAKPFVHIDAMMRPYVLTRLRDEEGAWEYTRYLAESNAVMLLTDPTLLTSFPRPAESEYPPLPSPPPVIKPIPVGPVPKGTPVTPAVVTTSEDVARALHIRDFAQAIPYLEQVVAERPRYHSGWLRLGIARREKAVDLIEADHRKEAEAMLREAVTAFEKASQHAESWGRADALYNLSKAEYRLWQVTVDLTHAMCARQRADEAYALSPDERYATWVEYLVERLKGVVGVSP